MSDADVGGLRDVLDGRVPPPPAIETLGFAVTSTDAQRGEITATCEGRPEFLNLMGSVQGGFLAAMLDSAMSCALGATLARGELAPTLEMKLNYLRPAPPGRLFATGRVVHRGARIAFLEGSLRDATDRVLVTGTATTRILAPR